MDHSEAGSEFQIQDQQLWIIRLSAVSFSLAMPVWNVEISALGEYHCQLDTLNLFLNLFLCLFPCLCWYYVLTLLLSYYMLFVLYLALATTSINALDLTWTCSHQLNMEVPSRSSHSVRLSLTLHGVGWTASVVPISVMCSYWPDLVISLTVAFCTDCSHWRRFSGVQYSTALQ